MTARSIGNLATSFINRKLEPVHRDSYDLEDARAKPWKPLGDGSREQRNVYRNALLRTLREHIRQQRCDAKRGVSAEAVPILSKYRELGREAAAEFRRTGDKDAFEIAIEALRKERDAELRRVWLLPRDLLVLEQLLDHHNAATGELFPAQETIADKVGWSRPAVNESLQRLQELGYLSWVRRSQKTGNAPGEGPLRVQASCAYYFDWKSCMARRVWARFWQLVVAGLKRLSARPSGGAPHPAGTARLSPELESALGRLGALVMSPSQ
jgi:hypothetical protein